MKRQLKIKFVHEAGFGLTVPHRETSQATRPLPFRVVLTCLPDGQMVRQIEFCPNPGASALVNAAARSPLS